jgi:peptide deformylase
MALLQIHTFPDAVLREKAKPVRKFNDELKKLVRDMAETLYAAPGIGLAANQIGVTQQVIVIDVRDQEENINTGLVALVNPRIISAEGEDSIEEGCLSVPEERAEVPRFATVKVEAQDVDGHLIEIEGKGLLAIVLQHEIDHLNGVLFIDHLSPLKRAAIKKRLRKQKLQAANNG